MIKRICSILTLIVLVLTECFMPMNYALAEDNAEPDFQIEENMNQDTYEEISDDDIESDIEDTVIETGNEELGEGENARDVAAQTDDEETKTGQETEDIQPEPENNEELGEGENAGDVAAQTDDEETKAGQETEDIQPEPENNEELGEGENAGDVVAQTDDEETKAGQETEDIQPESENNEELGEGENAGDIAAQTDGEKTKPGQETEDIQLEPENNEDNDGESTSLIESLLEDLADIVKYFFKKEGDIRYIKYGRDADNIGTITLKDPRNGVSITIMDKNLGAESVGVSRNSYGYYFQWGNNHGVKTVDSSNKTIQKAVYKDSYYNHGYDGEGKFIVGGTDYWEEGAHYNSLWGNESKESSRYGACPVGYHIPTMKEWNQMLDIWGKIHTQDTSKSEMVLRYSANYSAKNIHTFKGAATQCVQGDSECVDEDKLSIIVETLSSELKLPLAGSYDENGNFHDGLGAYWTSISKDGNKAGVFDMNAYIGNGTDDTLMYKSQGHNIRCFQNVEPYEAPVEIEEEENLQEGQEQEDQDDKETQEGNTENQEGEVEQEGQQEQIQKDIPAEFISYSLVLDTTKDFANIELNANGGKFANDEETKVVKYGYYNKEATIDVNALKQDEYRSGYEIKELPVSPVGYKLMDEVEIPTREGYIFDGWYARSDGGEKLDMNDSFVLENMEVYAHWVAKEYTITWKNEDGSVRDTTKVAYGQMPTHEDITQPADEKYTYMFKGWEPEIKVVTGDAEYRAKYTYTLRKYTVTWKNEDETVLKTNEVEYGTIPTYDEEVPTKESTEEFEYIFTGWDKEISEVKGDIEYIARYDTKEIEKQDIQDSLADGPASEGQTGSEIDSSISSPNDENISSIIDGGNQGSYGGGGGGNEQDSSDILEGQENSQEDENSEENQGFFGGLWETLKSFFLDDEDGYLRGSETIDDIVVSVEAEKGTFPIGTEVIIKGVSDERLESIQASLIEDETNNVTEDAQILAFDISFVYSGEEIQPEKEVSVKFNYKENPNFQGSSMSELSVYHMDDETDEGEEVEVVNKDGDEIEILATSFSTYAVVAQKGLRSTPLSGRGIMDQMPDFEFTGIVISRPASLSNSYSDSPAKYVVMDRNLGATEPGRGESSYGYRYQFGNNYGFSGEQGSTAILRPDADVNLTQYSNNNPYFSGVFVLGKDSGGTTSPDWATTSNNNIWGGEAIKESERQGPCPDGWHIPTSSEWGDVVAYWKVHNGSMNVTNFANELKIPLPGSLSRSFGNYYETSYGNEGYYWSTSASKDASKPSIALQITSTSYNSDYPENRANGYSIRCFKDDDNIYTITYNDGINDDEIFADQSGTGMRGDYFPLFVGGIPEWEYGIDFEGWYEEVNGDYVYVGTSTGDMASMQMTSDKILYAKWSECEEGQCVIPADEEEEQEFYDLDIYFVLDDNNSDHYTIADRNPGATEAGIGQNSWGYQYQWGNNHGFETCGTKNCTKFPGGESTANKAVSTVGYGPNNYYNSNVFIKVADWSTNKNDNLRGDTDDTPEARRGPCATGYHVPSSAEWLNLQNSWVSINSGTTNGCTSNPNCAIKIKNDLLLPSLGRRDKTAKVDFVDAASYWTSSPSGTSADGIYYNENDTSPKNAFKFSAEDRGRARSVRCTKNTYNTPITIMINGGIKGSVSVRKGRLYYLTDPTKEGFEFAGWYANSSFSTKIENGGRISSSTNVLYAKWIREGEVEYTFHANGGLFEIEDGGDIVESETFVQTYEQGDPFDSTLIQEPTRECYTFSGWYDAINGGNQIQFPATVSTSITAYAHWTRGSCMITTGTIGNGNITISPATGPYTHGSTVTFTAIPGAGYIFDKWMLNGGEILSGGNLVLDITLTGNVNLTGYFIPSQITPHTVTISSNNLEYGNVSESSVIANYGTQISTNDNTLSIGTATVTAIPSTGTEQYIYTFSGWDNTCGNILTGDCTITAVFERNLKTYSLDLIINTGIDNIYYKVNGADSFMNTGITTTITGVEVGSVIYAYAEPKPGYTSDTSSTNLWSVIVTGDTVFSPVATVSNVQYVVYHYVKRVGSGTYALTKTETGFGMTDEPLTLSSLAKESELPCAHYDRGSLTGTEAGPGEVVTETTIRGDGSTRIYLYYTRNSHTVTLSGDVGVQILKINGIQREEAVLECGSDVPVEAIPKPGYHFVRWEEREEKEEKRGEGDDTGL